MKKVTLKDIAAEAGLSINSASLALRGERVSKETQARVREIAERLGYVGNASAASIRRGYTHNIALIVGDIANPYFAKIIKESVKHFAGAGYNTVIYNTEESVSLERECINSAFRQNVDAILLSPVRENDENLQLLSESGIPVLVFGSNPSERRINSIAVDDEKGGYLATKHLIDSGRRDIIFINASEEAQGAMERFAGYQRALYENRIPFDERKVLFMDLYTKPDQQEEVIKRFLKESTFTGVVAYSDMLAVRIYTCMTDLFGSYTPDPGALVGFDHALSFFPRELRFPSVAEAKGSLAELIPERMMEILAAPEGKAKQIKLDVKLYTA